MGKIIEIIIHFPEKFAGLIALSLFVTGVAFLAIKDWKTQPQSAIAGILLGVLFGLWAELLFPHYVILAVILGVVAGPNIINMLHKKETIQNIVNTYLKRK